jgi:hypothetical protein
MSPSSSGMARRLRATDRPQRLRPGTRRHGDDHLAERPRHGSGAAVRGGDAPPSGGARPAPRGRRAITRRSGATSHLSTERALKQRRRPPAAGADVLLIVAGRRAPARVSEPSMRSSPARSPAVCWIAWKGALPAALLARPEAARHRRARGVRDPGAPACASTGCRSRLPA